MPAPLKLAAVSWPKPVLIVPALATAPKVCVKPLRSRTPAAEVVRLLAASRAEIDAELEACRS